MSVVNFSEIVYPKRDEYKAISRCNAALKNAGFTELRMGRKGASGMCCSSLNKTKGQTSSINLFALGILNVLQDTTKVYSVINGESYAVDIQGTKFYFEITASKPSRAIVTGAFKDLMDSHKIVPYEVVVTALWSILMNDFNTIQKNLKKGDSLWNEVFSEELMSEIESIRKNNGISHDQMLRVDGSVSSTVYENLLWLFCDAMYYGIKTTSAFEMSEDASNKAETFIKRTTQSKSIVRCIDGERVAEGQSATKKKKQARYFTEPLVDFYNRAVAGEFQIDFPWDERQQRMIVPRSFLETFVPTETFRTILLSVWYQLNGVIDRMRKGFSCDEAIGRNPINIKVIGKPGSGKTTVIDAVLAALGYPKGIINCKDRMEEDEIEGMSKVINSQVYSIPSKAGEIHSIGGAIILEEANLPDPGILQGSLGQALVYPYILKVNGYQELKRHPMTLYFATMNVGTQGTKPMNEALSSRFTEGVVLEDVKEEEFVNILMNDGYDESDCRKVYQVYTGIQNYLREYQEELLLAVTLRHCLSALDKLKIGFTEEQAYENTFISQIYSSDPEVAKDIRENVLKALI